MKILQVINSLSIGGAEKLILDTIPLYQQKDIKMDLLSLTDSKASFMIKLEEITNGEITVLSSSSIYNPINIFRIIPYLKKYDIVHVHLFPTSYWVVFAKMLSFSKVKLVFTEHNTHNRRRDIGLFRILDRFVYKRFSVVTAITEGVKIELQKHLNYNSDIRVINNGIDTISFKGRNTSGYSYFAQDDFKLIQVSSFRKQKDQNTIIRSLLLLPSQVKLILVGDGSLIEESKSLVDSLNLNDRVKFLGNRYDIPELMNYADVAILSSNWEGFGLAIIEGMAAGKPAIASDVDGIREIVNGYGLLFEKGNEKELAQHILNLLNDKEFYKEVSEGCLKRAQDFDINRMVDSYIELYKELL